MRVYRFIFNRGMILKGFTIGFYYLLITSCGLMGWGESLEQQANEQAAEEAFGEGLDLSESDTEIEVEEDIEVEFDLSKSASDGSDLISGPSVPCPTASTTYYLWYDHTCVYEATILGEYFYFEEISETYPFVLTIEANGEVVHDFVPPRIQENEEVDVFLEFKGHIVTDSDSCPVTYYTGRYPIRAEITGRCENEKVNLHIKMMKIDVEITGDCQLARGFKVPGVTSAPEIDHSFIHRENGDAYILDVPPGGAIANVPGAINCTYLFVLQPASLGPPDELELIPLIPAEQ